MIRLSYDKIGTVNGNTCPGVGDTDSLPEFLWRYFCPFIKQEITESQKDSISFFPIQPLHFDKTFGFEDSSVIDHISDLALKKLQDTSDGLHLLFFFPFEGYSMRVFSYITPLFFNKLTDYYKIHPNKILICYGDINIQENLYNTPVKINIPFTNILGMNLFEGISYEDYKKTKVILPSRKVNNRPKRFLYKNGVARDHRMYLAGALHAKGILDKCFFSWLNTTNFDYNKFIGQAEGTFTLYNNSTFNKEYFNSFYELIKNEPIELDISQSQGVDRNFQITSTNSLYNNSYASIVTETVYDEYNENILFTSEKTYQPIYNFHPFLLVSCPYSLENLKKSGYATFPELFDESYDLISDSNTRISKLILEIQKFSSMDINKLNDIYYSNTFQDKLYNNWEKFIFNGGKKEANKLYHWLLNISTPL